MRKKIKDISFKRGLTDEKMIERGVHLGFVDGGMLTSEKKGNVGETHEDVGRELRWSSKGWTGGGHKSRGGGTWGVQTS